MAIAPPSDIVLDVARAADPLRYGEAVARLGRTGGALAAGEAAFVSLLGEGPSDPAKAGSSAAYDPLLADLRGRLDDIGIDRKDASKAAEPYRKFEAFVLQSFVQSMLPKDADGVFGEGLAGDMWSSMLAEHVAARVADAGGLGIAKEIARFEGAKLDGADGQDAVGLGVREAARPAVPGFLAALQMSFADAIRPSLADDPES